MDAFDGGDNRMALVRTTMPDEAGARTLARRLIESRLAACVHVTPIRSTYRWKGKVEEEAEWLVEARCLPEQVEGLWEALLAGHPYETPLVEVVDPVRVTARYAAWARGEAAERKTANKH